MKVYQSKVGKLPGTNYKEAYRKAHTLYKGIRSRSKRRPYVRSAYFEGSKIFLGIFWQHIAEKSFADRVRRIRFFSCSMDLLCHSRLPPITRQDQNSDHELLHRFLGISKEGEGFCVQVKEDKKTDQKWLISIYPMDVDK